MKTQKTLNFGEFQVAFLSFRSSELGDSSRFLNFFLTVDVHRRIFVRFQFAELLMMHF